MKNPYFPCSGLFMYGPWCVTKYISGVPYKFGGFYRKHADCMEACERQHQHEVGLDALFVD